MIDITITIKSFDELSIYFEELEQIIARIVRKSSKETYTFDLLDTDEIHKNKQIAHKEKLRQMKIGEIWQEAIGSYFGFSNLYSGHYSGLDVISHSRKIAIEIKNRTNTDNASARKSNFDKLAKFKELNPDYMCVYGCINADTKSKTITGSSNIILHNGYSIEYLSGYAFLRLIFGNNIEKVIEFIKNTIAKYS